MRTYWDSAALVCALDSDQLREQLDKKTAVTRSHSLAEVFSTLTGGRLGYRVPGNLAARLAAELADSLAIEDLTTDQLLAALHEAERRGVRGGRVHDYLHAVCAKQTGASRLFTVDTNDFTGLVDGLEIVVLEHPPAD